MAELTADVLGVIEVLSRSGQLLQRLAWHGEELNLGRAYDNDIIVTDPYVCPHHLSFRADGGNLVARDLSSVNGSYLNRSARRIEKATLNDGDIIHFGHSHLRFRAHGAGVADTWRDTARHGVLSWFDNPLVLVLSVFLAAVVMIADTLMESIEDLALSQLAYELFYPVIGLMLWSGFWALINRIIAHRANLHVHLSIASSALVGLFVLGHVVELICFAFALDELLEVAMMVERITVLSVALYAHLRYATHGVSWTRAAIATVAGAILVATPTISDMVDRQRFSSLPELNPLLKPPQFQLRPGRSTEAFFNNAASLQDMLNEAQAPDGNAHEPDNPPGDH